MSSPTGVVVVVQQATIIRRDKNKNKQHNININIIWRDDTT